MRTLANWIAAGLIGTLTAPWGAASGAAPLRPSAGAPPPDSDSPAGDALVIRADRVIVRPGEILEGVAILVEEGRIVAIGPDLDVPEGARELAGEVVCAGFIDPWSGWGVEAGSMGDTRTSASTRTTDTLDLFEDDRLRRDIARAGVTCLRVQAGGDSDVGGLGALLRVGPGHDRASIVLLDDCGLAMHVGVGRGGRPADLFERIDQVDKVARSVGEGWDYRLSQTEYKYELEEWQKKIAEAEAELEKDFKKAKKERDKDIEEAKEKDKEFKEKKYKEDKKPRPPKYDADKEVLARIADGEIPLIVEAHRAAELRELLKGTAKYGRLRLIIAGGTQAMTVAEELAERRIPVIVRTEPVGGSPPPGWGDADLALAGRLAGEGVPVLLGSGGAGGLASRDLPLLAQLAIGHGLDREKALAALTIDAARALDVADRIGSVERGKDADLLVLDGEPLATTTKVRYAISGGRVVITPED